MTHVPPHVIFIHGAGQAGAAAWPEQAGAHEAWRFLPRDGTADDAQRDAKPPWELGLEGLNTRTLVLTGGERPLYEQTARELTNLGAGHRTFDGGTHRIQDDPRTNEALRDWLSEKR